MSHAITATRHRRVEGTASFRLRNAPLVDVNMPIVVRVHRREGGLEARRDQQVLKIFIATVDQEFDNFLCA